MKRWKVIQDALVKGLEWFGKWQPGYQNAVMQQQSEVEDLIAQVADDLSVAEEQELNDMLRASRDPIQRMKAIDAVRKKAIEHGAKPKFNYTARKAAKAAVREATRIDDDEYVAQIPNLTAGELRRLRDTLDKASTWEELEKAEGAIRSALGTAADDAPVSGMEQGAAIEEITATTGERTTPTLSQRHTNAIHKAIGYDQEGNVNGYAVDIGNNELQLFRYGFDSLGNSSDTSIGVWTIDDDNDDLAVKIRDEAFPDKPDKKWATFTDSQGTWVYDTANPSDRELISEAAEQFTFQERFNPNTGQYETFRVDETGRIVGDSLGTSYDVFSGERGFGEDVRQFNVTDARLRDQFAKTFGLQERQFGEDIRQFDMGFGENVRQFDTQENRMERTLAANNYFNSLEELGRNYRTFIQTAPQMANAATNQGQLIADILRSGGDVLARTYFTRGGVSPLPEITQADLINNLNSEMAKIQQFEVDATTAENRRRSAADEQRARDEFTQFKAARDADARAAYGRFVNEMRPTYGEETVYSGTNQAYADAVTANQSHQQSFADAIAGAQAAVDSYTLFEQQGTMTPEMEAAKAQAQQTLSSLLAAQGQLGVPDPSDPKYAVYDTVQTSTMPDAPGFSEWLSASEEFGGPQMGFEQWSTQVGPSFAPTPLLNVPQVPVPDQVTQAELIQQSRATTPPAVASVLSGQMPTPMQFGGLPLPTFQQLQALTPTEQQMLNTRLMTEFNVPLEDVAWQSRRQFGTPSMERNRDLARFRGYAV
tara:strand:+ start:2208 stop:4511 length:2304 start_codon:yes stop_codon:yes gene_type:complete